jgi:hypothetical protein
MSLSEKIADTDGTAAIEKALRPKGGILNHVETHAAAREASTSPSLLERLQLAEGNREAENILRVVEETRGQVA